MSMATFATSPQHATEYWTPIICCLEICPHMTGVPASTYKIYNKFHEYLGNEIKGNKANICATMKLAVIIFPANHLPCKALWAPIAA